MAMIDYGAMLRRRVIGTEQWEFVNKNTGLCMETSDTGYVCKTAYYNEEYPEIPIEGNYFVYAGDEDRLLCFYKGYFYVIYQEKIILTVSNVPFQRETFYLGMEPVTVEHLSKLHAYPYETESWEDFIRTTWAGTTGKEHWSELSHGYAYYKAHRKMAKKIARNKNILYKDYTRRWKASWRHKEYEYEVIFGYGITENEELFREIIKRGSYGYMPEEIAQIEEWFQE